MQIVFIFLLAGHLLAVNLASAGPLVAVAMARRSTPVDAAARRLLTASLAALVVGGLLGGAVLLRSSDGVGLALARFPARAYWFAAAELVFSAVCIVVMQLLWTRLRGRTWGQWLLALVALATSTNLLYHFPPLMGVFGKLVINARWSDVAALHRPALLSALQRPVIVFVVRQLDRHTALRPADELAAAAAQTGRRLARFALALTFVQFVSGVWLLTAVERATRDAMLGGRLEPTLYLAGGLFAAVKLAERLAAAAFDDPWESIRGATFWLCATVVLMSGVLWTSRTTADLLPTQNKTPRSGGPTTTSLAVIKVVPT